MSHSVDKLIQEWLAENECEDLPGKGKPLDLEEYFSWPEDLRLGFSILKNSGHLPEEVEQLRESSAWKTRCVSALRSNSGHASSASCVKSK